MSSLLFLRKRKFFLFNNLTRLSSIQYWSLLTKVYLYQSECLQFIELKCLGVWGGDARGCTRVN